METVDSWLLEDWNGTDCGDFFVGSRCRMSVYRMDVWMTRNPGWDGLTLAWIDVVLFGSSSVRVDYGRICRANISDVRCPASSYWITIEE